MIARPAQAFSVPEAVETPRLLLRRHQTDDAKPIARLIDNWNVVRWLSQVPFPYRADDAVLWIEQCHRTWDAGQEYQYVIARTDDQRTIGHIGMTLERDGRSAEFGYWLGQPYWGRGFAREAVRATLAVAFRALGLDHVRASCITENLSSLQILRHSGFVEIGRCRKMFQPQGCQTEVPLLALSRARYQELERAP